ncbi:outer membrane beta-barrel protein [Phnomibacter ginsenosidimutans]|uniref:outer membrane beta-barrel protein n=1 Tax=Phnomibacter ginsenosidimutans TaxID=2676868 RepID=UPI0018D21A24|nr:outer membrane beta-barrel protein [Phnomibacter ginsenosidimutans]
MNEVTNQLYSGLADGFDQSFWLWNVSAGKKMLKNRRGEIKMSVFDLLKQNQSIARNIGETYIEDVQTQVLQQYFMLTFTYTLRNFGQAAKRNAGETPTLQRR